MATNQESSGHATANNAWPIAAWTRPSEPGGDRSMAGPGISPPGLDEEGVAALQRVTREQLQMVRGFEDHLADVRGLLVQAAAGEPGALVWVTAAADTFRSAADKLEALTRRTPDDERTSGKSTPDEESQR